MKTSRSLFEQALISGLVLYAVLSIGASLYRVALPEPEQCALCESVLRCHAPAVMNLATGETLEMRVYEPDPTRPWEVAREQRADYFCLVYGAGLQGWCDGGIACHVNLRNGVAMNDRLFCRKCRLLLALADRRGYAILDLHDPEHFRSYAIVKGREYEINGYTVSVENGQELFSLTITTTGHLLDK